MNKRVKSAISLSMKAGQIKAGEFSCEKLIKSKKAKLIILAGDSSFNTKKKFHNKCSFYKIRIIELSDKIELSNSIGQNNRAVFAITDENFSNMILKEIEKSKEISKKEIEINKEENNE